MSAASKQLCVFVCFERTPLHDVDESFLVLQCQLAVLVDEVPLVVTACICSRVARVSSGSIL